MKAATDQELKQALQAATTPEAKRAVLAQAGYGDITLDDLKAAAADLAQREELSDEELERVSGGATSSAEEAAANIPLALLVGGAYGSAIGGPAGAGVGLLVGLGTGIAGVIIAADPPPPSQQ